MQILKTKTNLFHRILSISHRTKNLANTIVLNRAHNYATDSSKDEPVRFSSSKFLINLFWFHLVIFKPAFN